jgi:tRNA threonylcarbamoyladenosine biosynthesis protein TsaB
MHADASGKGGSSAMIVLAIDTSTDRSVIGLTNGTGDILQTTTDAGRRHGRDLIPSLKSLLASALIEPKALQAIAVGLGPGSYTGTRVGVTAAKTLAYITGAALIGLDSLHAIGRAAPAEAIRVRVIADAQRGELYMAELSRPAPGAPLIPVAETRIEALPSLIRRLDAGSIVIGPALESPRIRGAIPAAFLTSSEAGTHPRAVDLVEMAREAIAAGRRDDPWLLEPLYLRQSAAEDQWDARIAAPEG